MTTPPISARQLAGEHRNEARRARSIARTPSVVVGLAVLLTLAAGIAAAVDMRRLATPGGTTQAWVHAALVADCARYAELSTLPGGGSKALTDKQCMTLTEAVRALSGPSSVAVTGVVELRDLRATADVVVVRPGSPMLAGRVELTRASGEWRVLRNTFSCSLIACP